MFKVNNKNTTLLLTLTYFIPFSSVPTVNFEQGNVSWFTLTVKDPQITNTHLINFKGSKAKSSSWTCLVVLNMGSFNLVLNQLTTRWPDQI